MSRALVFGGRESSVDAAVQDDVVSFLTQHGVTVVQDDAPGLYDGALPQVDVAICTGLDTGGQVVADKRESLAEKLATDRSLPLAYFAPRVESWPLLAGAAAFTANSYEVVAEMRAASGVAPSILTRLVEFVEKHAKKNG